jgi:hypothetical protein
MAAGGVAVFSPVALTPDVKKTVSSLGELKYITAPDFEVSERSFWVQLTRSAPHISRRLAQRVPQRQNHWCRGPARKEDEAEERRGPVRRHLQESGPRQDQGRCRVRQRVRLRIRAVTPEQGADLLPQAKQDAARGRLLLQPSRLRAVLQDERLADDGRADALVHVDDQHPG